MAGKGGIERWRMSVEGGGSRERKRRRQRERERGAEGREMLVVLTV